MKIWKGDVDMYRIGDFSKMSKTTVKALRYYDESGLLKPAYVDGENGYRYYTTEQLLPLHHIICLRQVGVSIENIARIMSGNDACAVLLERKAEIETVIRSLEEQLSRVNLILQHAKEDYLMNYQAVIKEIPQYTVYYRQGIIPSMDGLQKFILDTGEECKAANPGIKCAEPDYCYVTYLDSEFKPYDVEVEYAQAVTKAGVDTENVKFKTVAPVTAVSVYHKGAYDGLREAFAFAFNWVKENGYEVAQRPRERYIDGIWNKTDPQDWLTEIQIPIVAN